MEIHTAELDNQLNLASILRSHEGPQQFLLLENIFSGSVLSQRILPIDPISPRNFLSAVKYKQRSQWKPKIQGKAYFIVDAIDFNTIERICSVESIK